MTGTDNTYVAAFFLKVIFNLKGCICLDHAWLVENRMLLNVFNLLNVFQFYKLPLPGYFPDYAKI